MLEDQILVPREFRNMCCSDDPGETLKSCPSLGYQVLFMPQLVDARIEAHAEEGIWYQGRGFPIAAPSIKATGETKQGTPVVVFAHVPNYFSNPDNIKRAIKRGLVVGAGKMPKKEFQRLLGLEDNENVFVVDYTTLSRSPSATISLSEALKHPQTVPFLGGKERAEKYLEKYEKVYGDPIGIWHFPDLAEQPVGRWLCFGNIHYGDGTWRYGSGHSPLYYDDCLDGRFGLDEGRRVFAVPRK